MRINDQLLEMLGDIYLSLREQGKAGTVSFERFAEMVVEGRRQAIRMEWWTRTIS